MIAVAGGKGERCQLHGQAKDKIAVSKCVPALSVNRSMFRLRLPFGDAPYP